MAKQNSDKFYSVITSLFIVAVLVVSGLFLFKYTNGFKENLKTFYITIDGKDIVSSGRGYSVSSDNGLTVMPKYVFTKPQDSVRDYYVKITSNYDKEHNFDFTVDGQPYSFGAGNDYTAGFIIIYNEDSFSFKPKGYLNEIMKAVYKDKEVSDCANKEFDDMFILTVYSYSIESSVAVFFTIKHTITGVSLDKTEVNL